MIQAAYETVVQAVANTLAMRFILRQPFCADMR